MDSKRQKVEEGKGPAAVVQLSDEELTEAVEKLNEVQDELEKVNERASDEILKVEQKYSRERKPIYEHRNELIAKIPDFWLTTLTNHPDLALCLSSEDHAVLGYLKELTVEDFPDIRSGHTISMKFEENPYLEDDVLTKTFKFSDDGTVKITGTKIRWKPGKDITKVPEKEANGDADKESKKRAEMDESTSSFFRWFDVPETEQDADGVEDEIAELIREDIWPNPLKFFVLEEEQKDVEDDGEYDEDELEGEGGEEGEEGEEGEDDQEGEEGEDEEGDLEGEEEA